MSTGSITDALSRITAIEQQLQQLSSGSLLDSDLGVSSDSSSASNTGTTQSADTGSTDFANALAQAQSTGSTSAGASDGVAGDSGTSFGSIADSALASASSADSASSASPAVGLVTGGVAPASGATQPTSASSLLTAGQQQFASTLSAETGLNPNVVSAWLLSEESGTAAQSREAAGNNDWLNVGYTDSGTYGASDSIWADPVTAANATAQWLQGQPSIPGYGTASAGVQSIIASVGQTPAVQIATIQGSGWASGGYPSLDATYSQVLGA